ncbi:MAG TPA: DinB family protein [Dehalococcoidia bacterium]|nr:DinB family protein [Dehalococcoidia bacterium]
MLDERDPQEPVLSLPKDWVLKALREAGNSLLSEFHGLDEEELRWRPAEGDLSLKEIAAHLRDAEELALAQLGAINERADGLLPAWDLDVLPLEQDYRAVDLFAVLAEFRRLRRETAYLLWEISSLEWERAAEHPYRGPVTLGQLARELAEHDLEHLWQVRRLKEQLAESRRERTT